MIYGERTGFVLIVARSLTERGVVDVLKEVRATGKSGGRQDEQGVSILAGLGSNDSDCDGLGLRR